MRDQSKKRAVTKPKNRAASAEHDTGGGVAGAIARALGVGVLAAAAAAALAELLALPDPPARRRAIAADPGRFRNPALGELLLDRARVTVHDSPTEALELAGLAEAVASRLAGGPYGPDFCRDRLAEARAHRANALRAQGDLRAARTLLAEAERLAACSADPFLRAEVASFAASLARDQRRWDEACAYLDEAERLFVAVDASFEMIARVRLKRASVRMNDGAPREAAAIARGVLDELERTGGPSGKAGEQLRFVARHNLVSYLCEAGDHRAARDQMERIGPTLDEHRERSFRLRARWLRGKIAHGLGELDVAERELGAARDGFLAAGLGLDAAIVALDLAVLFAGQGRDRAVRRIAAWTTRLFEARDVHPDALAALGLFRRAALREALGAGEIRRLVRYLQSVRTGPPVRFEAAS